MNGGQVQKSGDWGGGDRTEMVECPLCGEEVINNQLYNHLATDCEGGGGGER